ncbi:MAG TPA: vWA domain-containing protein [Polyangiales bacterium]|nr:vWA domain-containing protein [Polyangiales bacterium]
MDKVDTGKVKLPDPDDIERLKDDPKSILKLLFPKLSDDELAEITGKLSLSEVLALRTELEAIRKDVAKFSADLFKSAGERVNDRKAALEPHNDGFPDGLEPLGRSCTYDAQQGHGEIQLSGVFSGKERVVLESSQVQLKVDGKTQAFELECLASGPSVDLVFLIDITGSMSNVIAAVRDSVVNFVDILESSGVRGTVSVVTYQDSVGVNRTFQDPAPAQNYERSPFFKPVSLAEAKDVDALRAFVNRLEANRGADAPENLAAAVDFARNNVIGYTRSGEANVIGDGKEDPAGTSPFPALKSDHQVFVALTDITFHGDDRTPSNSSLLAPFLPRDAREILSSLRRTGTVVHVSDPSWVDEDTDPSHHPVDADYWAMNTGGLGKDVVEGYSLVDLELVVVAQKSGLLDITLDKIIGSSCSIGFDAQLAADAKVELELNVADQKFTSVLDVVRL